MKTEIDIVMFLWYTIVFLIGWMITGDFWGTFLIIFLASFRINI